MIKKELGVYLRGPGRSDQKTDSGRFGQHPRLTAIKKTRFSTKRSELGGPTAVA